MADKRLILATPSPLDRMRMAKVLAELPGMTMIAQTSDLSETYTAAEALRPDLVVLAENFTLAPEFECMKALFGELRTLWMVLARVPGYAAGASGRSEIGMIDTSMPGAEISARIDQVFSGRRVAGDARFVAKPVVERLRPEKIVLIGASTGGVDALVSVLQGFPENCPPTAVVQHTGKGYSQSLTGLLDRRCRAKVVMAEEGMMLRAGTIVVAAGTEGHLRLTGSQNLRCSLTRGDPISGHIPSVDALFSSACAQGSNVVAALLTGMGRDGAAGLLELRRAGSITIGQDEATSVVYGMPKAAWEIGAVQLQLPLEKIGPALLRSCGFTSAERVGA